MHELSDRSTLVLYDADCGICSRTARLLTRLDRGRRLQLVPAQAGGEIPGAPPLEARLAALQVRDPEGGWISGGAAVLGIADALPVLRPIAFAGRIPGGRRAIECLYALVAANRHRISRALGMPACPREPR